MITRCAGPANADRPEAGIVRPEKNYFRSSADMPCGKKKKRKKIATHKRKKKLRKNRHKKK
jgi:hypothetical protein